MHPEAVPLFLEAKKIQKAALVSNFVDRERERPALGPNDFIPIAMLESVSQPEAPNASRNHKRKSRYKFQTLSSVGSCYTITNLIQLTCSGMQESGKENDDWLVISASTFSLISLKFPGAYLELFSSVCIFVNLSFVFLLYGRNAATLRKRLNPSDLGEMPKFVLRKFWE